MNCQTENYIDAASLKAEWEKRLAVPETYTFEKSFSLITRYEFAECNAELYLQANGPGTSQQVLMVFPKTFTAPAPAVVVPFYFPAAMLGFELETQEDLPFYAGITMMTDLAKQGIITISAEAYHLTYLDLDLPRNEFARWQQNGAALKKDYPAWSGVGKLMADTRLLVDVLESDSRVDSAKIGIAGHSLGGKMAFYAGCFDPRIKVILTSDFGFRWEQSNWEQVWYWGDDLEDMKKLGMEHWQLLEYSGNKPFALLAGKYDNESSLEMILQATEYKNSPEKLCFVNHATGHRPPQDALRKGYEFLLSHLK